MVEALTSDSHTLPFEAFLIQAWSESGCYFSSSGAGKSVATAPPDKRHGHVTNKRI